jgi:hypothetical protein
MRTARQILVNRPGPPYRGSVPLINAMLRDVLHDLGYETSCLWRANRVATDIADWMPLRTARTILQMQSPPAADVEIRDNISIHAYPLVRRGAQKNVVLLHALVGLGDQWLGNDAVDGLWANSDYVREVVASFLAMPGWKLGRLLDPRAFSVAGRVTLPLPYLELPQALLETGPGTLPASALAALEGDDVLGHCVSRKLDERATYAIMLALNQLAQENGIGRRYRLFIESYLYDGLRERLLAPSPGSVPPQYRPLKAALDHLGLTVDDILIPVPRLAQSALFKLVGACRFGLQYHSVPEAFGLFPLESVCLGCPIYTNGAGNLRYLLPPGHGINVVETEAMAFGDPAAFLAVARQIFQDTAANPEAVREACRRGTEHIAATYTREAMKRDVAARLAELERPPAEHGLDELDVALGPMVRSWNPETRRIVSDYKSLELTVQQAGLLREILGRRCRDLEIRRDPAALEIVDGLFDQGVLALSPPAG